MTATCTIATVTDAIGTSNVTATGTCTAANTVSVTIVDKRGNTVGPTSATVTSTNWSLAATDVSSLVDGTLIFEATADDGGGNEAFAAKTSTKAALNTDYVTEDEFRDFIRDSSGLNPLSVQTAISAASAEVNSYCHRKFYQKVDTQLFEPDDWWTCSFDDMDVASKDGIQVHTDSNGHATYDTVWTVDVDYVLMPENQSSAGIENWPFESMRTIQPQKYWPLRYVPWQVLPIKVIATWGWPTIPYPVKQATLMLANMAFSISSAPLGYTANPDVGAIRVRSNPVVQELLRPYARSAGYGIS